ncbi:hypothetical protein BEWA_022670 [Theileria equi strain WA]|uniref:Guanylate-binding protein N-terminal domain-containing protein n=1 Tax=Theileria equi strain WA TaxID=1537102 RepID=L0AX17_THEEQ|nr:hypothetical protein BEWA_022670 [Theileria equi strain WA]AFZ79419.1 hypothetical protein BEWA_022670 [Theileria equi strain WA]|eukprot:XP_004829085.1 hypothetical protein BEWA_022670 [Theileria equi strain WA]
MQFYGLYAIIHILFSYTRNVEIVTAYESQTDDTHHLNVTGTGEAPGHGRILSKDAFSIRDLDYSITNLSNLPEIPPGEDASALKSSKNTVSNGIPSDFCFAENAGEGKAIELIYPTKNHTEFQINEEALEFLKKIPKPIAVLGVVGSVHVGKSSFLNAFNEHILCGDVSTLSGFPVASSVDPETEGIWMWTVPLKINYNKLKNAMDRLSTHDESFGENFHLISRYVSVFNQEFTHKLSEESVVNANNANVRTVNLIMLDIGGFNSSQSTRKYDEALFSIAATLSSELVYVTNRMINSQHLLDIEALTKSSNLLNLKIYSQYLKHQIDDRPIEHSDGTKDSLTKKGNVESILEMMKNKTLTIMAQDFVQSIDDVNSVKWLHTLLSSFRHDLTPRELSEYINEREVRLKELRNTFSVEAEKNDPSVDYVKRLSSSFKYGIQYLFHSVDCILLPPPANSGGFHSLGQLNKDDISFKYLENLAKYKFKVFSRALNSPRKKLQIVNANDSIPYTFMSGADLVELIKFLIYAINHSLTDNMEEYISTFKYTKLLMYKNDLCDVYRFELLNFISQDTIPVHSDLYEFNKTLLKRIDSIFIDQIQDEISAPDSTRIKDDLSRELTDLYSEAKNLLHNRLTTYCKERILNVNRDFEAYIANIAIPLAPNKLDKHLSDQRKVYQAKLLESINAGGALYSDFEACSLQIAEFNKYIDEYIVKFKEKNGSVLEKMFASACNNALTQYKINCDFSKVENYRKSFSNFKKLSADWKMNSINKFNEELAEFIHVEYLHYTHLSELQKGLDKLEQHSLSQWNSICIREINAISEKYKNAFRGIVSDHITLPSSPDVINVLTLYIRLSATVEISELYCADSDVFRDHYKSFMSSIKDFVDDLYRENYQVILGILEKKFEELEKQLEGLVHSYNIWYNFSTFSYKLALDNISSEDVENLVKNSSQQNLRNKLNLSHLYASQAKLSRVMQNDLNFLQEFKQGKDVQVETEMFIKNIAKHWIKTRVTKKFKPIFKEKKMFAMKIVLGISMILFSIIGLAFYKNKDQFLACLSVFVLGLSTLVGYKTIVVRTSHIVNRCSCVVFGWIAKLLERFGAGYVFTIGFTSAIVLLALFLFYIVRPFNRLLNRIGDRNSKSYVRM